MLCRNIGILCAFFVGLFLAYVAAAETARPPRSKGEVLVFRRGKHPSKTMRVQTDDVESQHELVPVENGVRPAPTQDANKPEERPVFHWNDICYDVDIKGQSRRILSQVDGWVQPGKSTALMVR
jgi:ATP-binding cassette, subfamily G (WHITE), member 2, PDR